MPTSDRTIARLAERQYSILTRAQAIACGLTEDEVDGRLGRGVFVRLYRSVYKIAGAPLTREGRVLAAVLAGGRRAPASHTTAASLVQFEAIDSPDLHVTVPRSRRVVIPGVVVHQSAIGWGRTKIGRIPATSPARALIEIAAMVSPADLEDALDDIWRRRIITMEDASRRSIVSARAVREAQRHCASSWSSASGSARPEAVERTRPGACSKPRGSRVPSASSSFGAPPESH